MFLIQCNICMFLQINMYNSRCRQSVACHWFFSDVYISGGWLCWYIYSENRCCLLLMVQASTNSGQKLMGAAVLLVHEAWMNVRGEILLVCVCVCECVFSLCLFFLFLDLSIYFIFNVIINKHWWTLIPRIFPQTPSATQRQYIS